MKTEVENRVEWKRVLIYCAFAFGISYAVGLVVYLTGGLAESPLLAPGISLALVLLIVYMLTPAIANLLTRVLTREGWKAMYLRPIFKKGWLFWLIAWFGTPLLIGVGIGVYFLLFP